jgi:hypothetical protein
MGQVFGDGELAFIGFVATEESVSNKRRLVFVPNGRLVR